MLESSRVPLGPYLDAIIGHPLAKLTASGQVCCPPNPHPPVRNNFGLYSGRANEMPTRSGGLTQCRDT